MKKLYELPLTHNELAYISIALIGNASMLAGGNPKFVFTWRVNFLEFARIADDAGRDLQEEHNNLTAKVALLLGMVRPEGSLVYRPAEGKSVYEEGTEEPT